VSESYEWKSVTGFGVQNTVRTQCDYMLVGVDVVGRAYLFDGHGWHEMPAHPERVKAQAHLAAIAKAEGRS
jgi:hypothetical protein